MNLPQSYIGAKPGPPTDPGAGWWAGITQGAIGCAIMTGARSP